MSRSSSNDGVTHSDTDSSSTSDSHVVPSDHGVRCMNGRSNAVLLAQNFHPAKSEMKAVFATLDENNDGLICTEDLARFVKRFGLSMSADEARSLVGSVDQNHDGKLDFEEFYSLYHSLADSLTDECRQTTIEELDTIYEEEEHTLLQAFKVYDSDNNGFISVKELHTVLKSMDLPEGQSIRRCERVIKRVAANPKQGINFREFKAMMCSGLEGPAEP